MQLLEIFVCEKMSAFVTFYNSNKEFVDDLGKISPRVTDIRIAIKGVTLFRNFNGVWLRGAPIYSHSTHFSCLEYIVV